MINVAAGWPPECVGFARLVRDMRDAQREFFDPKRRRPDTVARAKVLERRVDAALAALPDGPEQGRLF